MSLFNLKNKSFLITGSSKGIGKSIAFSSADLFQDDELIATASSSIKLKDFESRNWIDDTIGKNVKIIS